MPSAPATRHHPSTPPAPVGFWGSRAGLFVAFFVLIGIAQSIFGITMNSAPARTETVAEVLEVRPYRRTANAPNPRLWVRFRFTKADGTEMVSTGRVQQPSSGTVAVGDRITISYGKRKPIRPRIVSTSPPRAQTPVEAAPTSGWMHNALLILIAIVPLIVFAVVASIWFKGLRAVLAAINRAFRAAPHARPGHGTRTARQVRPEAAVRPPEDTASRSARPQRAPKIDRSRSRPPSPVAKAPRKKSKSVQRAGWFT